MIFLMIRLRTVARSFLLPFAIGSALRGLAADLPAAGFPLLRQFTELETGTSATVSAAIADRDGTIHFGADELLSYDGGSWRRSALSDGLAIRQLAFAPDGRMWVAAARGLGWYDRVPDGTWRFHSLRGAIPFEHASAVRMVSYVFAEDHGAVFVSEDAVLRWDGVRFKVWRFPGADYLSAVRTGGTIYVRDRMSGFYELTADGPQRILTNDELPDASIWWMNREPGNWLIVTSRGLFHRTGEGSFTPVVAPELNPFAEDPASRAIRLADGRFVLGTFTGLVWLLGADGRPEKRFDTREGIPPRPVAALCEDRTGGLWIGMPSMIVRLSLNTNSTAFDQRAGLRDHPVEQIAAHGDQVITSTADGVFRLDPEQRNFELIRSARRRFRDMRSTPQGVWLAGTLGTKLLTETGMNDLRPLRIDAVTLRPSRRVPGQMLISEGATVVRAKIDGTAVELVNNVSGHVGSIAEDRIGRIWLGTVADGILVADLESGGAVAPRQPRFPGLPATSGFIVVLATADGGIALLAPTGGWFAANPDDGFSAIVGQPARTVYCATDFSPDGVAWLLHSATDRLPICVARLTVDGAGARWEPHAVEGLETIGQPSTILATAGGPGETVLWIGGSRGILRHVVGATLTAPRPITPALRAYVRDTDNAVQALSAKLPYSTRAVAFEFAAPDFARRPQLRFETKIDGLDADWTLADASARRELTALRDGAYAFHVRTVAETGTVSEPASVAFDVLPPWWRTLPAAAGLLFVLTPLGYGAYRLRLRTLQRRNDELEAKVRERTEQLALANAAKTEFVANMSHDIRNPLNGIVGLALALEDTRLDTRQQEIVATLRECTTYLSSLVDDVLDFASIEAGRVELRPGPFAPAELLRSVVTTLKADTAECGAVVELEVDARLPASLSGDAGRIQQILVNYVSNALKYAGGRIRLGARIAAGLHDEVEFSVTDEGPGISDAEQAALFTKFNRLAAARRVDIAGAGLGLASCRLLADIMGGSVGVESRPGRGSRFFLRLPLAAATEPAVPATGALPNTTVLLVEDTDYNAMAATAVLSRLGLTCERARTGAEALALFAAKRFNLVLLDRNLPDMDGTEVARRLRAMETDGLQAIVLAVTAYCTAEDRQRCLDAGMDAFVGKPLTPEKLRRVLLAASRRLLASATFETAGDTGKSAPDIAMLDYLSDGTPEGLEAQIERFLAGLVEAEAQLGRACAAGDFGTLGNDAHRLLGHARMIGGGALAEVVTRLEQAARQGDRPGCQRLLSSVITEIRALTEALRRRRSAALTT